MPVFNRETLMGIDIAVKSVSKKYPFIVGWELSDDAERYEYTMYITLLINSDKISKYFNVPIVRDMRGKPFSSLNSIFTELDSFNDKELWDKEWEFYYSFRKQIENDLYRVYELIPEDYIVKTKEGLKPLGFSINEFLFKNPE